MLKALWTAEKESYWEKYIKDNFEVEMGGRYYVMNTSGYLKKEEVTERLHGKDVYICGYDKVTREAIESNKDLKLILSVRDGPEENIDIQACTDNGVPIIFANGRCAHSVAELTLGFMLCFAKPIVYFNQLIRTEKYTTDMREHLSYPSELDHKTLGLVGFGRNGKQLSRICRPLGMNIIVYDPYVSAQTAEEFEVKLVSLDEVMSNGDYICLLARVTPETTGLINMDKISLMKKTAVLINTGRSKLTVQDDVFNALENDLIRGAALDVFDQEPLGEESRAYDIPAEKLIMTPHIAGISHERTQHQYENIFLGFDNYIRGSIVNVYNTQVFESEKFAERGGVLFNSKDGICNYITELPEL